MEVTIGNRVYHIDADLPICSVSVTDGVHYTGQVPMDFVHMVPVAPTPNGRAMSLGEFLALVLGGGYVLIIAKEK